MAMNVGGSGEGQSYSDINMTPLIDVMLVLLIIFIITIPSMTHAVKIDNPPPNPTPPTEQPEVIDLTIDFDGTLLWNKTPVDRPTLQGYISQEAVKSPQPEVHIRGDASVRYQYVGQVLVATQQIGIRKVAFITTPDHFGPGT